MIERAFEEARKQNRGAVQRFALDRAREILKAAGIKDPNRVDIQPAKTRTARGEATTPEVSLETFLEGKRRETLVIGGKSPQQLEGEVDRLGEVLLDARYILRHRKFTTLQLPRPIDLVWLRVQDLVFPKGATTVEIFGRENDVNEHGNPAPFTKGRMTELGLGFCPAEVGPHQRLADKDQPMNTWYYIAMEPITDRRGSPDVFELGHDGHGLWLRGLWADPDYGWSPEALFVFSPRKDTSKA